jgi:hypothetical protein
VGTGDPATEAIEVNGWLTTTSWRLFLSLAVPLPLVQGISYAPGECKWLVALSYSGLSQMGAGIATWEYVWGRRYVISDSRSRSRIEVPSAIGKTAVLENSYCRGRRVIWRWITGRNVEVFIN